MNPDDRMKTKWIGGPAYLDAYVYFLHNLTHGKIDEQKEKIKKLEEKTKLASNRYFDSSINSPEHARFGKEWSLADAESYSRKLGLEFYEAGKITNALPVTNYSTTVFDFKLDKEKGSFSSSMLLDVFEYGENEKETAEIVDKFIECLPELLSDYKSNYSGLTSPKKTKTVERAQENMWPRFAASKSKKGNVIALSRYEGKEKNASFWKGPSIHCCLTTDYIEGQTLRSNGLYIYFRFDNVPVAYGERILSKFSDFSHEVLGTRQEV